MAQINWSLKQMQNKPMTILKKESKSHKHTWPCRASIQRTPKVSLVRQAALEKVITRNKKVNIEIRAVLKSLWSTKVEMLIILKMILVNKSHHIKCGAKIKVSEAQDWWHQEVVTEAEDVVEESIGEDTKTPIAQVWIAILQNARRILSLLAVSFENHYLVKNQRKRGTPMISMDYQIKCKRLNHCYLTIM